MLTGSAKQELVMIEKSFQAIMVSETHWDRAWYVPFETFRIRLVRLIDRVIAILDSDPNFKSFMLDGQMLPIEDYLEIRPERRADLERLVRAGRLVVGPWYALADEFLVSPEALVRNLMVGLRIARELGGSMMEGYVPDAFGHINQLPQILQGFGIGSAVFWRGVGDEGDELGNEFWWQAPDGTKVLAVHLPDGYHNASNLGYPMRWGDPSAMEYNPALALQQVRAAVDLLKRRARTPYLLLMNGIDHAEADPNVPAVIRLADVELPDVRIEHGKLDAYIAHVRATPGAEQLAVFEGEFNRGRYAVILQGVYSSRMYLKQANERVQGLLERYAEPLAAWAWSLGSDYPAAFLDHAWRRLLQNHPHDDICGCSVDAVHRENMARYADAEQVASVIARDSFRQLVGHVDRSAQPGVPFVLFNPLAWPRSGTAELSLLFDQHDETARDFRLVDPTGRPMPCQVLAAGDHFDMEVLKANRKREVTVAVSLDALPSCGYRVYYAQAGNGVGAPGGPGAAAQVLPNGAENRYVRLEINPDGSLDLLDKETGRQCRKLGYFEDTEDAGDEYDYSPAPQSETVTSLSGQARCRVVHAGPLQVTHEVSLKLSLPPALTSDRQRRRKTRVNCPITFAVTLRRDSRAVEIRAEVDNRARDHRLRVRFPTGLAVNQASAGGHFDVITRPVDLPQGAGWTQPPVPAQHQRGFVDVSDSNSGLAVFSRGLPEYEIVREDRACTIAVTLLRCVDAISRGGMLSRPSHAGIPCEAPEAQCQGRHVFEYAIRPHAGNWQAIYREAAEYQAPVYVRRGDETEGYLPGEVWAEHSPDALQGAAMLKTPHPSGELPGELSLLALLPDVLVLSAVKRSEQGDALIVRFYNPTGRAMQGELRTYRPLRSAQLVNLNESPLEDLVPAAGGDSVTLSVGPKQVRTIAIQF
jgi:mannosylglycerate hydrolase